MLKLSKRKKRFVSPDRNRR
jgi:hypothetical protein